LHALLGVHGFGVCTHWPVPVSHAAVLHALLGVHTTAVPPQTPLMHLSPVVHAFPSSQGELSELTHAEPPATH
jgi:hypothetical protein